MRATEQHGHGEGKSAIILHLEQLVRDGHITHPEDGQLTLRHAVNQLVERGHITPDSPDIIRARVMGAALRNHREGIRGKA